MRGWLRQAVAFTATKLLTLVAEDVPDQGVPMEPEERQSKVLDLFGRPLGDDHALLVNADGEPRMIEVRARPSRQFPTRLKVAFVLPLGIEEDGEEIAVPLPLGNPSVGMGQMFDIRLEMN